MRMERETVFRSVTVTFEVSCVPKCWLHQIKSKAVFVDLSCLYCILVFVIFLVLTFLSKDQKPSQRMGEKNLLHSYVHFFQNNFEEEDGYYTCMICWLLQEGCWEERNQGF